MKAVIHCHSNFSYDSAAKTDHILDFCLEHDVELLILSDHDTVQGSLEIADKIKSRGLNIICPPAAEYKTEFGDIILVGFPDNLKSYKFDDLVKVSRDNNCKLLFPHPYHDHKNIEYMASKVDFIEVFNSRNSLLENKKALELAKAAKKSTYASPDAHLLSEYKNCIIEYDVKEETSWHEILNHEWLFHTKIETSICNIYKSAFIKSLKTKSLMVFIKSLAKICILCTFLRKYRRELMR